MTASNSRSGSQTANITCSYLNTREYEDPAMIKRFTPIAEAMRSASDEELGFDSADVSPKSLSMLAGQLRAFTETALGKNARKLPSSVAHITKFPHKLFSDYRPDGGLYVMLCACLNFKCLHGLRRLEFQNPDKQTLLYDMLTRIDKALQRANILPKVKVFFSRAVPSSMLPSLRAIVQKRGTVVSSASAATHIIYQDPKGTTLKETGDTDYCRPLKISETHALVHWWYYPDSYDSWIPNSEVDGVVEPPEEHVDAWHIQLRWLQDTELYNEWMNEADYEVPFDIRIKVSPAPRSEPPAATKPSHAHLSSGTGKHDHDRSSKKRRRSSQSASASREIARDADKEDEMDLGNSTPDSEGDASRRQRRGNSENPSKERKSRESSRKDSEGHHPRKRTRTSEDRKKSSKRDVKATVKLRLPLKPPQERTKDRQLEKERTREGRGKDSSKGEIRTKEPSKSKKDSSSEIPISSGLKVRVKLGGKVSEPRRILEVPVVKGTNVQQDGKESPLEEKEEEAAKVEQKSPSKTLSKSPSKQQPKTLVKEERLKRADDDVALKTDEPKPDHADAAQKSEKKDEIETDASKEEVTQEQKKPFSRRKRSRKERTQQNRAPGVTPIEDAIPIPEGEVPRIRNISNEGTEVDAMEVDTVKETEKPPSPSTGPGNEPAKENGGPTVPDAAPGNHTEAEFTMDVENFDDNGRVIAVSEKMLSGAEANAPASGADVIGSLSTITIRMPAHTRWFRLDAVHDIEKRALPEFFDKRSQSKTPMVYKKYRDFMIEVWRQAPEKYLTATAARRHLAGDVCAILRVHAFLERWGLINYGTEPESKPYLSSSLKTRSSRPKPIILDGPAADQANGVPRLLFFDEPRPAKRDNAPVSLQKAVKNAKEKAIREKTSLLTRRELYATAAATKYECDACGADCSRMRYHCVSTVDMELCPNCFANGMYPETLSARDFEQLTTVLSSEAYDGSVWSEAEVLLLLEGLEKFGDDWNQVADHVGSKTNEQCVMQFLRMPIEDSFLGDQLGKWDAGSIEKDDLDVAQESISDEDRKFAGPYLPFADTSNPVMAQVAFLASCVSPEVAAAAAQAALNQLLKEDGAKVDGVESKTAQAQALLSGGDSSKNEQRPTENGIASGEQKELGSKLRTLPGSQLDSVAVEAAASVGLAAAVVRSRQMADAERREIERDFAVAVETKLRAVDVKIQEFERLEQHLRRERDRMERHRHGLFAARIEAAVRGGDAFAGRVAGVGLSSGNVTHQGVPSVTGKGVPFGYTGATGTSAGSVPANVLGVANMVIGTNPSSTAASANATPVGGVVSQAAMGGSIMGNQGPVENDTPQMGITPTMQGAMAAHQPLAAANTTTQPGSGITGVVPASLSAANVTRSGTPGSVGSGMQVSSVGLSNVVGGPNSATNAGSGSVTGPPASGQVQLPRSGE